MSILAVGEGTLRADKCPETVVHGFGAARKVRKMAVNQRKLSVGLGCTTIMARRFRPEAVIEALTNTGVKVVPTGLAHVLRLHHLAAEQADGVAGEVVASAGSPVTLAPSTTSKSTRLCSRRLLCRRADAISLSTRYRLRRPLRGWV